MKLVHGAMVPGWEYGGTEGGEEGAGFRGNDGRWAGSTRARRYLGGAARNHLQADAPHLPLLQKDQGWTAVDGNKLKVDL